MALKFTLEEAYKAGFISIDGERVKLPGVMPEYLAREELGGDITVTLKESRGEYLPHAIYRKQGRMILDETALGKTPEICSADNLEQLVRVVQTLDAENYRLVA